MTMLDNSRMITAETDRGAAVILTRSIQLVQPREQVASARMVATAHGIYEARLNGRLVSDAVLAPGWSAYEWRLQVQEYDVTELVLDLVEDRLDIEVLLGNGWWRGDLGFEKARINYGADLGFIAELAVTYRDGSVQAITTGPDWSARRSDVLANSLYNGQTIDARLRGQVQQLPVREVDVDRATFVPQDRPLITRHEVLPPTRIWTSPAGKTLVDFGQNLVGWIRLRAAGPAGAAVTVRHAEVLERGELCTRPLRDAQATDRFLLSGDEDVFEPTLTFHGFRYVEIAGLPGELAPNDLEAVVVHSAMRRTGTFECSDPLVNRLVENSVWGQKGNFLDIPTDCPQRDERLGWTGDIAAYAATAAFQFDVADLLHSWLLDLAAEARHSGYVPFTVPDLLKYGQGNPIIDQYAQIVGPTAIWGDAAVWVPEALWRAYGDRDRLAAHYPGMVLHLESVQARLSPNGLWDQGFQFGDWLDPLAPPDEPFAARADSGVVATACLYRSASFAAEAARELAKHTDAERWAALARRTRTAFNEHYVDVDGRIRSDAITVYALAIEFGLLDPEQQAQAGDRLADLVAEHQYTVATGFAGTPFVTGALTRTGHVDAAYRLLLQTENPSWLYAVIMGGTTIWERWDAMLPDGTINPGEMTSFNHYALGSVADWLYQHVAGIQAAEPGYTRIRLQPTPGPGLDWARGALNTRAGRVECGWRRAGDAIEVTVTVPVGVAADVVMPDGSTTTVSGGTHRFVSVFQFEVWV